MAVFSPLVLALPDPTVKSSLITISSCLSSCIFWNLLKVSPMPRVKTAWWWESWLFVWGWIQEKGGKICKSSWTLCRSKCYSLSFTLSPEVETFAGPLASVSDSSVTKWQLGRKWYLGDNSFCHCYLRGGVERGDSKCLHKCENKDKIISGFWGACLWLLHTADEQWGNLD